MGKSKVDKKKLMAMIDEGKTPDEMTKAFGATIATIKKHVKKIEAEKKEETEKDEWTLNVTKESFCAMLRDRCEAGKEFNELMALPQKELLKIYDDYGKKGNASDEPGQGEIREETPAEKETKRTKQTMLDEWDSLGEKKPLMKRKRWDGKWFIIQPNDPYSIERKHIGVLKIMRNEKTQKKIITIVLVHGPKWVWDESKMRPGRALAADWAKDGKPNEIMPQAQIDKATAPPGDGGVIEPGYTEIQI